MCECCGCVTVKKYFGLEKKELKLWLDSIARVSWMCVVVMDVRVVNACH